MTTKPDPQDLLGRIRSQYPDPIPVKPVVTTDEYCVGGAFCLFVGVGVRDGFPPVDNVMEALERLNPNANQDALMGYAILITEANDSGDIDGAWDWAAKALRAGDEA